MKALLSIDGDKLEDNMGRLVALAKASGAQVMGVTKGVCGNREIAQRFLRAGAKYLADSRVENLAGLGGLGAPRVLLRAPGLREAEEAADCAEICLVSQVETAAALSAACLHRRSRMGVLLMVDLGDLREGVWWQEQAVIFEAAQYIAGLPGVQLMGLGTNMTCFGGVVPTRESYGHLADLAQRLRQRLRLPLPLVSGGNSSCLNLLRDGWPAGVNNVRVNQAVLTGRELAQGTMLPGWHGDAFTLLAEVIELQRKPSAPQGPRARMSAFGPPPEFVDRGLRRRALLKLGRQDVELSGLRPLLPGAALLGGSSDHLVLDVSDCTTPLCVGDWMPLALTSYASILSAMTSPYVEKRVEGSKLREAPLRWDKKEMNKTAHFL